MKLRTSSIIHAFALLHVATAVLCRLLNLGDELALTTLTIVLTVILCLRYRQSVEFSSIVIIIANILGYLLGNGIAALAGTFINHPLLSPAIATFTTTESMGWGLVFFMRRYAVKAFEAGSIDYLLKPIDASALKRAVERCRQFSTGDLDVEKILGAISRKDSGHGYKERYLVQFNDRIVPVKADEIAFFYSEDKNNHVVTHGGAVYIVDSTMDSLITGLDPERFFRISRSCIFSKDAVECVTKLIGGRLRVTPKVRISTNLGPAPDLTVSRSRADDFLAWLGN